MLLPSHALGVLFVRGHIFRPEGQESYLMSLGFHGYLALAIEMRKVTLNDKDLGLRPVNYFCLVPKF